MARMPDGFVFITNVSGPKVKDGHAYADVSVEERELVMCKNCRHYDTEPYGDVMFCYQGLGWTEPEDYCSKGERGDEDCDRG